MARDLTEYYDIIERNKLFNTMQDNSSIFYGVMNLNTLQAEYINQGIDGMGMSGANDHSIDEIGYTWALPMQSKRTAVLLYRLLKQ